MNYLRITGFILWLFLLCNITYAEGTKELMPTMYHYGRMEIYPDFSPFAFYGCPEEHRLCITVCNPNEKIYFGFGNIYDVNQIQCTDMYYRLRAPDGTIVIDQALIPITGDGFIDSYSKAVSGPVTFNSGGYSPIIYDPQTTGDFYIEFYYPQDGILGDRREVSLFDITVANDNGPIKGRVWSKAWQITTTVSLYGTDYYQNPFYGKFYIYADDGIVTSIDFNGMKPLVFMVCSNQSGCFNSGNPVADRKSVVGYYNYPQYKIFLNNPDENCFPTGVLGDITSPPTFSGCTKDDYCINISVNKTGTAELFFELNGIAGYQGGSKDRLLIFPVYEGDNCIPFDGLDGLGNPIPTGTAVDVSIKYYNGITHLPLTDVEYNEKGYKVRIEKPVVANNVPPLFWDDSAIPTGSLSPTSGCTDPSGCHDYYNFFGDSCTINTWWYATSNVTENLVFTLRDIRVDANENTPYEQDNDTIICIYNDTLKLNGYYFGAPQISWTGTGGTFLPSNSEENPSYVFSQQEINNGIALLTLTTHGPGTCPSYSSNMKVIIESPTPVYAGEDFTICTSSHDIVLSGSYEGSTGYFWSGGNGTFYPDAYRLNAQYLPTDEEVYSGHVQLSLIADPELCPKDSDQVDIYMNYIKITPDISDVSCNGKMDGNISITYTGNHLITFIEWYNGSSEDVQESLSGGEYCVTVSDVVGCSAVECIPVFEPDSLMYSAIAVNESCNDIDKGYISLITSGGVEPYNFYWSNGMNTESIFGLNSGEYYVTIKDHNNCLTYGSLDIFKDPNPPVNFNISDATGCSPAIIQFFTTAEKEGKTYIWNFGDGSGDIVDDASTQHLYLQDGVYDISLTVVSQEGCDSTLKIDDLITIYATPKVDFYAYPPIVKIFDSEVSFSDISSENTEIFLWDFGDGGISFEQNPFHTFDEVGEFDVKLIGTTIENCSDTAAQKIIVKDVYTFYAPSAFTPGNDNINEIFNVYGTGIDPENFSMIIYDRWGEAIFSTSNLYEGWNGKSKGRALVPTGTYTWVVLYKDPDGKSLEKTGPVTVIR